MGGDILQIRYHDEGAVNLINLILARGGNPAPLMAAFGARLVRSVRQSMFEGGRPVKFAPLKIGTFSGWIQSRKTGRTKSGGFNAAGLKAIQGRKPLIASGQLAGSIRFAFRGPLVLAVGSDKSYAAAQFLGAKIPPLKPTNKKALFWPGLGHPVKSTKGAVIPARNPLTVQPEDWAYFKEAALRYFLKGEA